MQTCALSLLHIGYQNSPYPNGDLNTVVFTLTEEEFAAVCDGDPVIVQYGTAPSDEVWQFGNLDKTILDQYGIGASQLKRRRAHLR
jgi:hypothetical protein